jgi:MOSC domain-containing protein YiiM
MSSGAGMQLLGVQVGQARKVLMGGRAVMTAIRKTEVAGAVAVKALGLEGDEQVDLSVHGGLEKAVYAYPSEHYGFWREQRSQAGIAAIDDQLDFGAMGENLSLAGLLETDVWVGDVLAFANCTLRVAQPREPCFKFNAAMGFNTAVKEMALSGFCGFYLRVDEPGTLQAGESFELVPGPRNDTIAQRFQTKVFKHLR